MITFYLMNVLLSISSFLKIGLQLDLLRYNCVPVSVFNFTLNSFHVAELNWGSIRGVFETVRLNVCVCLCVCKSIGVCLCLCVCLCLFCVFGKVLLSLRLPYNTTKDGLLRMAPFVRRLGALLNNINGTLFEEEQTSAFE